MKRFLSEGFLGVRRAEAIPSVSSQGPNAYLSDIDFLKMLGLAAILHVLVFGIAALVPRDTVTDIPVRALSFKIGESNQIAAYRPAAAPPAAAPVPAPVMQATHNERWQASQNTPTPSVPAPLKPIPKPVPKPVKQPKIVKVEEPPKPLPTYQPAPAQPAIAPTPQQYVREVGGAPDGAIGGQGSVTTMTEQTAQAIRARYEQEISGWIQRHKFYPPDGGGREGRAIVRVRIDRAGNVRYYAIEQSAGIQALDNAALDMIRRANPLPAVPANYPAGNLVEFLIPISFKAPQ